jgi:anti-sigma regulatory factor (Ser/Thr protein kinase)
LLDHFAPAQLPPAQAYGIELVLEEVLMNIVWHAYGEEPGHTMTIEAGRQGDEVVLAFEDQGVPFDPTSAEDPPLPTSLEDAKVGGLGLMLVRKFAREVAYERCGGTNRLKVVL